MSVKMRFDSPREFWAGVLMLSSCFVAACDGSDPNQDEPSALVSPTISLADPEIDGDACTSKPRASFRGLLSEEAPGPALDPIRISQFSRSLALFGDWLVVGGPHDTAPLPFEQDNTHTGAFFVYKKKTDAMGRPTWSFLQRLSAYGDEAAHDELGSAIAVDDKALAAGAWGHDSEGPVSGGTSKVFAESGTVRVYERYTFDPSYWGSYRKLSVAEVDSDNHDWGTDARFGTAVQLQGDMLVVGAPQPQTGMAAPGAVYVFVRSSSTGAWQRTQRLNLPWDANKGHEFGHSLALHGDVLLIGAPGDTQSKSGGRVYVSHRDPNTRLWSSSFTELRALAPQSGARFGNTVSLGKSLAAVGATLEDVDGRNNQGATYVFRIAGTTFSVPQRLIASDGSALDSFGYALQVHDSFLVVGAPFAAVDGKAHTGAAYVFQTVIDKAQVTFKQHQKIVPNKAYVDSFFGASMVWMEGRLSIGAYGNHDVGTLGDVFLYAFDYKKCP